MHLILTEDKSAKKACNAMVPNPIYEGPLYESIQPEFSTLTTPGSATNMMESRYLDIPIHPVMLNEPSKTSDNGAAIGESGTPNQRNGEENAKRESSFLETRRAHIPGSEDNYTVMSPIGTLAHSLQGGWGILEHLDPEATNKNGSE